MILPSSLSQALSLDILVLQKLLKRHKNSHGRTRYYRHMDMAYAALQRYQIVELEVEMKNLEEQVQGYKRKSKKKKKAYHWELKASVDSDLVAVQKEFSLLQQKLTTQFPEISSRILHASTSLYTEVTRGFFLPFCTVALGALARIFSLTNKLGRMAISQLHNLTTSVEFLPKIPSAEFEKFLNSFLQEDLEDKKKGDQDESQYQSTVLRSIGLTVSSKKSVNSNEATKEILKSESMKEKDSDILKASLQGTIDEDHKTDDDDLGESVVRQSIAMVDESTEDASKEQVTDGPSAAIDRNTALLQEFKNKKASEGQKEKRKKLKKRKDVDESSSSEAKKKKKKKKAKKSGDFFDSLFD